MPRTSGSKPNCPAWCLTTVTLHTGEAMQGPVSFPSTHHRGLGVLSLHLYLANLQNLPPTPRPPSARGPHHLPGKPGPHLHSPLSLPCAMASGACSFYALENLPRPRKGYGSCHHGERSVCSRPAGLAGLCRGSDLLSPCWAWVCLL